MWTNPNFVVYHYLNIACNHNPNMASLAAPSSSDDSSDDSTDDEKEVDPSSYYSELDSFELDLEKDSEFNRMLDDEYNSSDLTQFFHEHPQLETLDDWKTQSVRILRPLVKEGRKVGKEITKYRRREEIYHKEWEGATNIIDKMHSMQKKFEMQEQVRRYRNRFQQIILEALQWTRNNEVTELTLTENYTVSESDKKQLQTFAEVGDVTGKDVELYTVEELQHIKRKFEENLKLLITWLKPFAPYYKASFDTVYNWYKIERDSFLVDSKLKQIKTESLESLREKDYNLYKLWVYVTHIEEFRRIYKRLKPTYMYINRLRKEARDRQLEGTSGHIKPSIRF